jgi:hypothetical protein
VIRYYCLLISLLAAAPAAMSGTLRAGAARIEITPPEGAALRLAGYSTRVKGFEKINDPLYVRAVVLDDGSKRAAIVTVDLLSISHPLWERVSGLIAAETAIPAGHILLTATHTHSAPSPTAPGNAAYMETVVQKFVAAVREAQSRLQPARVGAGAGRANINMNRRARTADGGFMLGRNPDGPSDKTLAVVKIEAPDGTPIAIFMNYGVHGTVQGNQNLNVSGDLPGATSLYVERALGGKAVAQWTSGAAGDQNPIYRRAPNYNEVLALGRILGDETLRVVAGMKMSDKGSLYASQKVIQCPGHKSHRAHGPDGSDRYTFEDAPPTEIRLSLLKINYIALAGVSGEVLTMIGQRLKKESPLAHTIVVTHTNGASGYIPDDAAYADVSYEIGSSRVKKGCAEDAIVNGFLEMMDGGL